MSEPERKGARRGRRGVSPVYRCTPAPVRPAAGGAVGTQLIVVATTAALTIGRDEQTSAVVATAALVPLRAPMIVYRRLQKTHRAELWELRDLGPGCGDDPAINREGL